MHSNEFHHNQEFARRIAPISFGCKCLCSCFFFSVCRSASAPKNHSRAQSELHDKAIGQVSRGPAVWVLACCSEGGCLYKAKNTLSQQRLVRMFVSVTLKSHSTIFFPRRRICIKHVHVMSCEATYTCEKKHDTLPTLFMQSTRTRQLQAFVCVHRVAILCTHHCKKQSPVARQWRVAQILAPLCAGWPQRARRPRRRLPGRLQHCMQQGLHVHCPQQRTALLLPRASEELPPGLHH